MNEEAQPKKTFYRGIAVGTALVLALVLVVRAGVPDFPSASSASMVFFAALALATSQLALVEAAMLPIGPEPIVEL